MVGIGVDSGRLGPDVVGTRGQDRCSPSAQHQPEGQPPRSAPGKRLLGRSPSVWRGEGTVAVGVPPIRAAQVETDIAAR